MAVDVPAYGTIAEPETYRKYKAALAKVQANNVPTQNVLWFSHPFEKAYAQAVEQMKDNDIKKALAESDAIRGFLPSAIVADFPVLAFHNFWISRDSSGRHHVVSCWFTVEPNGRSLMQGLYSTSDDLADLMKQVWFAWKEQSAKGYMSRFLSIPVSAIEEK